MARKLKFLLGIVFILAPALARSTVYIEPSIPLINQNIQINAGAYSYYQFDLSAGDQLVAKFISNGGLDNRVGILLVDYPNFLRFQSGGQYQYYRGTSGDISGLATFSFPIPQQNRYVLVIDNRKALMLPRTVNLYVYALTHQPNPRIEATRQGLAAYVEAIHKLLKVDDFDLTVKHCGSENAFSDPNITICTEIIEKSKQMNIPGNILFVMFHELGHSVLKLWGYPFSDNEDVADEFATVMLIMSNRHQDAYQSAQYWISRSNVKEAIDKISIDDRHTISAQRARNIINWLNNSDDLLRRWQKILVPNLQTPALEALNLKTDRWVDHDLITKELASRAQ